MIYEDIRTLLPAAGWGVRRPGPTAPIVVRGPDAEDFLQRLSSQDVVGLAVGACAPAAFLTPKGKLVATAVLARTTADTVWVEPQVQVVDPLVELLERYHFTERLSIERPVGLTSAMLFGPGSHDAAGSAAGTVREAGALKVIAGAQHGFEWVRAHGPDAAVLAWQPDAPAISDEAWECLRMIAGWARIGTDSDATTLALELPIDDHVSMTKGCYTGQEIVARIHTYGHVNRKLSLVRIATTDSIEPGVHLCETDEGDPVGRVTSAVRVPGQDCALALAYLPTAFCGGERPLALGAGDGPAAQVLDFGPA